MKKFLINTFKLSYEAWIIQVKLTTPALIIVRLLMWFGLLGYFSIPFQPIMGLIGLPKEMALVWVTAMLTNNYAAVVICINVLPAVGSLTVAQATVLGLIILVAHNLPVEGGVCRGAGVSPMRVTVFRIFSAILFGFIVTRLCSLFGLGQGKAELLVAFSSDPVPPWGVWIWSSVKSLLAIFAIVWVLLVIIECFRKIGLMKIITASLAPVMRLAGVGQKATMITVIGMLLGLAYGGGLIIAESKSGNVPKEEIYGSIILMAICHSLLEDTIILGALGGSIWGLLVGRLIMGVALAGFVIRMARRPQAKPYLVGRKYYA
jgi:spore maturation protein SpmB